MDIWPRIGKYGRGWRLTAALLLLSLLSAALYLGWTAASGALGFPLDDGWIHQTYARNLAQSGQLAYLPGQPSSGSTAPLWTTLLSLGYVLRLDYRLWSYALGGVLLALTARTAYGLARRAFPDQPWAAPLAALGCAFEWHLAWAAFSGMETLLFTWLALALMVQVAGCNPPSTTCNSQFATRNLQFALAGIVAGLLTLTRPEGALLAGLAGLSLLWRSWRSARWRGLPGVAVYGLAFAAVVAPWLAFNLRVSGQPLPNTFYAKQAEYQALLGLPLWTRLARVLLPTLTGGQILLLPGFLYASLLTFHPSLLTPHSSLLPPAWWLLSLLVYALRLPVSYQHGRYLMPIIPVFIVYGVGGTLRLLRPGSPRMALRAASRSLLLAALALLLAFWLRGARAFAEDTGFIEGEMVAVARWLEAHTPPEALIAVHDIGAVGYLAQRPLLDLAGLITPQVVPFIGDEARLLEFMARQGAAYVVFFPDWSDAYRRMAKDPRLQAVYVTGYVWTRRQGRANMVVFQATWPPGRP